MKNLSQHLATLAITAWVGGLWVIGYLAVPVLFYTQPDRELAGDLAGEMFIKLGYLGMVCGMYLLIQHAGMLGRALHDLIFRAVYRELTITGHAIHPLARLQFLYFFAEAMIVVPDYGARVFTWPSLE